MQPPPTVSYIYSYEFFVRMRDCVRERDSLLEVPQKRAERSYGIYDLFARALLGAVEYVYKASGYEFRGLDITNNFSC